MDEPTRLKNLSLCYLCVLLLNEFAFRASDGFCPTTPDKLTLVNNSPWLASVRRTKLFRFCECPTKQPDFARGWR